MKHLRSILLMSEEAAQRCCDLARQADIELDTLCVNNSSDLECAFSSHWDLLLSFGTGVIVPAWIIEKPDLLAINIHAASPSYPGRDPHHFAIYDAAKEYGATLHYMTRNVDAGPIIDVELFEVPPDISPLNLLNMANQAGWKLIQRFFEAGQLYDMAPIPLSGQSWGEHKSTRKMFLEMCRIEPPISAEEIQRRYKATFAPGYQNLYIDLHGYRFRIEETLR